jgi:hypothetical protein
MQTFTLKKHKTCTLVSRLFPLVLKTISLLLVMFAAVAFCFPDGYVTKYPTIPIIDAHIHIGRSSDHDVLNFLKARTEVKKKCNADIAMIVDLDGGQLGGKWISTAPGGVDRLNRLGEGRMVAAFMNGLAANNNPPPVTAADVERLQNMGFVGYKMHFQSHTASSPHVNLLSGLIHLQHIHDLS